MMTQAELKEILNYDPESGVFTWLKDTGPRPVTGKPAGSFSNGYWRIAAYRKGYRAHRLAWLYMTGEWPTKDLDHKDQNKLNNCFKNLREATWSQNGCNRGLLSNNTTGYKGVYLRPWGTYEVRCNSAGIRYFLGIFKTAEEASEAYQAFAKQAHGEFFNSGKAVTDEQPSS